ncbi:MAG TPA: 30S ribosomal protein S4 [Candidatus Paceibacterota bacterium]|nr:small subunit ribosomal protein [Patescibacteria group bacterium]
MRKGPQYKTCRRLGEAIFPKCQTTKFAISGAENKNKKHKKALSEYGAQLLEKQKARLTYGVTERQFSNYVKKARNSHGTNTPNEVFKMLESRLDNVVFRLGLAPSRAFGRQMVSHGHVLVNGRRLNIPSYSVKTGDKIAVRPQSKGKGLFTNIEERLKDHTQPNWVVLDDKKLEGEIKTLPEFTSSESNLNFSAIIEYYSRV